MRVTIRDINARLDRLAAVVAAATSVPAQDAPKATEAELLQVVDTGAYKIEIYRSDRDPSFVHIFFPGGKPDNAVLSAIKGCLDKTKRNGGYNPNRKKGHGIPGPFWYIKEADLPWFLKIEE